MTITRKTTTHSAYLRSLASGEVPLATDDLLQAADQIDKAKLASDTARLQLARSLDYALTHCQGLTDESSAATDTLKAIAALDGCFPQETEAQHVPKEVT